MKDKNKQDYIQEKAQQTLLHQPIISDDENIYISEGVIKTIDNGYYSFDEMELPF